MIMIFKIRNTESIDIFVVCHLTKFQMPSSGGLFRSKNITFVMFPYSTINSCLNTTSIELFLLCLGHEAIASGSGRQLYCNSRRFHISNNKLSFKYHLTVESVTPQHFRTLN
jgi:hypothetical protein